MDLLANIEFSSIMGSVSIALLVIWIILIFEDIHSELEGIDTRSGYFLVLLLLPIAKRFGTFFIALKFLPLDTYQTWAAKQLKLSGMDDLFTPVEYVGSHVLLMLLGTMLPLILLIASPSLDIFAMVFSALLLGGILCLIPFILLSSRIRERNWQIFITMPYFLDLLTLLAEAGMEFTQAIERANNLLGRGPLQVEMSRFSNQLRMGRVRREALMELGDRTELMEMKTFVLALIRQSELGTPLGETLQTQSEIMRRSRLRTAEAQANQAPVKMLIPMILFIFPSIFILLVGPMVLKSLAAY